MSFPQNEIDRWKNIYGAGSIGFALHDNTQREDVRKFIVQVAVKQFICLEDTCLMFPLNLETNPQILVLGYRIFLLHRHDLQIHAFCRQRWRYGK